MNTALWIITGFLTVLFLVSGIGKLFVPRDRMAKMGSATQWVLGFSPGALKTIGAAETLGAVGLVLPAVTGIVPVLVPLAALGLTLLMAGAVILRIRRREPKVALLDGFYLALTAFVAIGRFAIEPFTG